MPPKPSYISIDYKSTKDVEIAVFMTENMKWFNPELAYSSQPKKYSLDGKGAFTNNGQGNRWVFNVLKPTTYILNAGMNDRKTIKLDIFKENLNNFIEDLNYTVPKCKVIYRTK